MWKKTKNVSNETIENENVAQETVEETKPTEETVSPDFKEKIQNISIDRVRVVAKYNNGSFEKGCEYEISKKVLENYNGLFDVL